jgi:signal transduction histidine kinase
VHELRTPLSVASSEVDLALARERSAAYYREALARIAERLAEAIDATSDFGFLAAAGRCPEGETAALDDVLHALAERFGARRGSPVRIGPVSATTQVRGAREIVTGALALILEHAVRHRRGGACVHLQARVAADGAQEGPVPLMLDAGTEGFAPAAWVALDTRRLGDEEIGSFDRDRRLLRAVETLRALGGSVMQGVSPGPEYVVITLETIPASTLGDLV